MRGRRGTTGRSGARSAALARLGAAGALVLCLAGAAGAEDVTPLVSPDRVDDVPSTKPDPFPAFDNFAWRAFVALNWPSQTDAAHRGEPDRTKSLGDPGPRVWETFKERYEALQSDASGRPLRPAAWASYDGRNPCGPGFDNRVKTLAGFAPYADFNQASFTPGVESNALVAQNGAYTRYEVRINRPEFEAIAANRWYATHNLPSDEHPARLPAGSIAVKAAWRPLTDADTPAIRARYYVVNGAAIVDVAKSRAAGHPVCGTADVALVGLHIAVKTTYRPQWIWSTFEHVDNVPPAGEGEAREPDAKDAGAPYSYFDPKKPPRLAPPLDSPGAWPISADNPPALDPAPMQVVRKHPIHPSTMAMNRAYWALPGVKGGVWEHYMLVASQWPTLTQPQSPTNDGSYFPGLALDPNSPREPYQTVEGQPAVEENLVNTTMETYTQDSPSSCMACHHSVSNARGRDFVGILPEATKAICLARNRRGHCVDWSDEAKK